ncbi:MAG: hypothetical protein AAF439_16215 [Pseudomonadota bacterium]
MSRKQEPFFVGYLPAPNPLRRFLLGAGIGSVAAFAAGAAMIGATQDDPGSGAFRGDFGRQTVTGVLELKPYPLLRVTRGNERIPDGHTLMLSAAGKRGLMGRAGNLDGKLVTVSGILLKRGELDMLQVRGGKQGLAAAEGEAPPQTREDLGRWRLAGEICDGKCLAGAMRPGRGLAHKACANLCLVGGIPPVFVSTQPVDGSEFLLIGGPDGSELPQAAYDRVGEFISVEGTIERRGDVLVFTIDPATMEVVG